MTHISASNVADPVERQSGDRNAADLVQNIAKGAHQTIDRLTDKVTPHAQRLQENMSSATEILEGRAGELREVTDEWVEALRCTVRENPLAAVGAAVAFGLLLARLSR